MRTALVKARFLASCLPVLVLSASISLLVLSRNPATARTLVFLGNENLAPVVFADEHGPTGLAVEIVRELAKRLPHPIEVRVMDWGAAQQLVLEGEADALIQINMTPERRTIYDFSEPLLESRFSIFTRVGRVGLAGISGLRGQRVGVEAAGLPRQALQHDHQIMLRIIPDFIHGFRELSEGTLDAIVVDYIVGSHVLALNKIQNITTTGEPIVSSSSAIAVKKGNVALLDEINTALRAIRSDGTYDAVIAKWKPKEGTFYTHEQMAVMVEYWLGSFAALAALVASIWALTLRRELNARRHAEAIQRRVEAEIRELNQQLEHRIEQRTAALSEANKELEAFSYSVSHDLRAPLRAINGLATILRLESGRLLDEQARHCVEEICANSARLAKMIADLLEFFRMPALPIASEPLDVGELARAVFAELTTALPGRRVVLKVDDMPPAYGDKQMIRQVLSNLLSNAMKFTRMRTEQRIHVGGAAGESESTFWVKDNGVGFDMRYAHKMFDVFERLHDPTAYDGTGIGLAIVKRIIVRHGGRVWAESKVNEGASLFFTLPKPPSYVAGGHLEELTAEKGLYRMEH